MAEREVRYCTTEDGVRIAYRIQGEGPPFLVCPAFVEQFTLRHTVPVWDEFISRMTAGRTLIDYDERGTGLSDREGISFALADQVCTLEAVARAARLRRFVLFGTLLSGPASIAYAARHPRTVSHLILYGTASRMRDVMPWEQLNSLIELARSNWDVAAQTFSDLAQRIEYPEVGLQMAELWRSSTTGGAVAERLLRLYEADVDPLLSSVTAPVLVLHRREDGVIPFRLGQQLASRLPRGSLVPLEGRVHPEFLGDSGAIIDAIDKFLGRPAPIGPVLDHARRASLQTMLVTDLVGHTEMMQRLGDAKGRDVLREHERITRETLKQHGGTEVKTMGDGFMATFASVTKAMDCAISLQRAFTAREGEPLEVRVGLNAGEPIEEDGDLFGSTVILTSRIAAKAGAGEILIPEPLRHLLSGKSYEYSDRGEVTLKGFEDAVRLYEVCWRD